MKKLLFTVCLLAGFSAFAQTATSKSLLSWEKYVDSSYTVLGYDIGVSSTNVVAVTTTNLVAGQILDEDPALPNTTGTFQFLRVNGQSITNFTFVNLLAKSVPSGTYKFWCRPVGSNAFTVGSYEVGPWTNIVYSYNKKLDKINAVWIVP
jgi:hypothetical protein